MVFAAGKVGKRLEHWTPPASPGDAVLEGRLVRLEPLLADLHAADLFRAFSGHDALWTWMAYGPFTSASAFHRWAKEREAGGDPRFLVLRDQETGHCGGVAAFMRITPEHGVIEVGSITIAPEMQQSAHFTEAMWLMMDWAFRAGYRRYEWKCDALNLPSRRAAQRLGFSYEGVFRQHMVIKGRTRDTAWFSITDSDWPALSEAFRAWLAPRNFNPEGQQIERLSELTGLVRVSSDPGL